MRSPILPISLPSPSSKKFQKFSSMLFIGGGGGGGAEEEDQRQSQRLLSTSPSSCSSSSSFEEERKFEKKPFLTRAFSYTNNTINNKYNNNNNNISQQQRRRRVLSDTSLPSLAQQPSESLTSEVGHAAAETCLITRLGFKLLGYLGVGYRWITKFLALSCYAMLLIPGFIQVGYYYFRSPQVRRSIVYGDQPRNRLDLYLPAKSDGLKPVVAFITGGAWIIGYKAWGSLLGQQLAERDVVVACIDYRCHTILVESSLSERTQFQFPVIFILHTRLTLSGTKPCLSELGLWPGGTITDMVKDASEGISFVCNNIAEYGGDPNRIYLMGQSAGAHIAACALIEQAIKETGEGDSTSWSVSQIKAYFGLSGGYNLLNLVDHFHGRGLYRSIFLSIMGGEQSFQRFSPEVVVEDPNNASAVLLLPPIVLFHGTADYSIPSDSSKCFVDALQRVGAQAELILYEGKTHTDLFLQDPMRGGKDELLEDILSYIHAGDTSALAKDAVAPPRRRLVPEFMLKLAHKVSPF